MPGQWPRSSGEGQKTSGANSIVSSGQGGGKFVVLRLVVDASILGNGMLLALAMGAVGGLLPAANSIRLQPLEALR